MHSTGNMSSFLQIMARPSTAAGTPPSTVDASTWCSTPSWSNHHRLSWVRMRPLSGISLASTWSKALIRSLATTRTQSWPDPLADGLIDRDVEVADLAGVDVRPARQFQRRGVQAACGLLAGSE